MQQGYECTRRYLEELVAARTQRLTQSSRHTSLGAGARPPSHSAVTLPPQTTHSDMSVLANEQMLREIASNVGGLLPTS